MSVHDPLAHIRDLVNLPCHMSAQSKTSRAYTEQIEVLPCFKGTQEIRFSVIGAAGPERILVETFDKRDGEFTLSRWLEIEAEQVPDLLEVLLQADAMAVDLSLNAASIPQSFPVAVGQAQSESSTLRVSINRYKDHLNTKVSKTLNGLGGQSDQWFWCMPVDLVEVVRKIIATYDALARAVDVSGAVAEPATNEIQF